MFHPLWLWKLLLKFMICGMMHYHVCYYWCNRKKRMRTQAPPTSEPAHLFMSAPWWDHTQLKWSHHGFFMSWKFLLKLMICGMIHALSRLFSSVWKCIELCIITCAPILQCLAAHLNGLVFASTSVSLTRGPGAHRSAVAGRG